jgi:hypothetical protein
LQVIAEFERLGIINRVELQGGGDERSLPGKTAFGERRLDRTAGGLIGDRFARRCISQIAGACQRGEQAVLARGESEHSARSDKSVSAGEHLPLHHHDMGRACGGLATLPVGGRGPVRRLLTRDGQHDERRAVILRDERQRGMVAQLHQLSMGKRICQRFTTGEKRIGVDPPTVRRKSADRQCFIQYRRRARCAPCNRRYSMLAAGPAGQRIDQRVRRVAQQRVGSRGCRRQGSRGHAAIWLYVSVCCNPGDRGARACDENVRRKPV